MNIQTYVCVNTPSRGGWKEAGGGLRISDMPHYTQVICKWNQWNKIPNWLLRTIERKKGKSHNLQRRRVCRYSILFTTVRKKQEMFILTAQKPFKSCFDWCTVLHSKYCTVTPALPQTSELQYPPPLMHQLISIDLYIGLPHEGRDIHTSLCHLEVNLNLWNGELSWINMDSEGVVRREEKQNSVEKRDGYVTKETSNKKKIPPELPKSLPKECPAVIVDPDNGIRYRRGRLLGKVRHFL